MSEPSGSGSRVRAANFSSEEKITLFKIIDKYKQTLENKKTDAVSNKEKEEAWNRITAEFNATSPQTTARSKDSLKRFYENKKKELRKKVANQKIYVRGTGGGPPPPHDEITNQADELLLSIVNKKTVFGLKSSVGGDVDSGDENQDPVNAEASAEANNQDFEVIYEFDDDYMLLEPGQPGVASKSKEVLQKGCTKWDKYKGADLKEPTSSPLRRKSVAILGEPGKEAREEPKNKIHQTPKANSRRRPAVTVRALTSSDVASKYNTLLNHRLELLIELSKEKAKEEIIQSRAKHEKEMALLDIKLEIEREKLKRMKYDSTTNWN